MKVSSYNGKATAKGPKNMVQLEGLVSPEDFGGLVSPAMLPDLRAAIWRMPKASKKKKDAGDPERLSFLKLALRPSALFNIVELNPVEREDEPSEDEDGMAALPDGEELPDLPACRLMLKWTHFTVLPSEEDPIMVNVALKGIIAEIDEEQAVALMQYVQFEPDLEAEFSLQQLELSFVDEDGESFEDEEPNADAAEEDLAAVL